MGTTQFDTTSITATGRSTNGFIAKLDSNGNRIRVNSIRNDDGTNEINGVSTDNQNNILIAGDDYGNNGSINYNDGEHIATVNGQSEAFILKVDPNGSFLRAQSTIGSSSNVFVHTVDTDSSGNSYLAGYLNGLTRF